MDSEQGVLTAVRVYVAWHRCDVDARDHAVTDEEFARGRRANSAGRYESVCGHVVVVGSMLRPPGSPCMACRAFVVARSSTRPMNERTRVPRQRQASRWLRLFRPVGVRSTCAEVSVPAEPRHTRSAR